MDYFIVTKKIADQYLEDIRVITHRIPGVLPSSISGHCPVRLTLSQYHAVIPSTPPNNCAIKYDEFAFEKHKSLNMYFQGEAAEEVCKKIKRTGNNEETELADPKFSKMFEDDTEIEVCTHSEPAVVREVKKEGKNKGRPFFACSRPPGHPRDPEARCNFFKWADDYKTAPKCEHDLPSVLRRVQKEGANKGK